MTRRTLAEAIADTIPGVQHDFWVDSIYIHHDPEWDVYCTPFWEDGHNVPIVCQNHDGDVLTVAELSMGHNAHLRTIPENVETFRQLLPLIRRIAASIIDHHRENA